MPDLERKSIEPMAVAVTGGNIQAMQRFISQGAWSDEATRVSNQAYPVRSEKSNMLHFRRALGLLVALFPLLTLLLMVSPAMPAQATTGVVVGDGVHPDSCNMLTLGAAMNGNTDAAITFNCGGPATITVTQSGGLNVVSGQHFTIKGGDIITMTGLNANRLFWVQAGSALT